MYVKKILRQVNEEHAYFFLTQLRNLYIIIDQIKVTVFGKRH